MKCWCVDQGESVQKLDGAVGSWCWTLASTVQKGELQVRAQGSRLGGSEQAVPKRAVHPLRRWREGPRTQRAFGGTRAVALVFSVKTCGHRSQ